ncbi:MAG: zinc-dependent alcohol dehydrogenase family protein [Armatimonadota bacterium]|nr:zinc-dependent alcohol dehydrogenase family protein [Armatimonadota bacterium]MDW8157024.1 zinc-dependent alcohol dehydrogenase family protein [Armatimonadota bacterium]
MRAAVLHAPGQPLALEERPVPHAGPGEVLVRVHACAVCRTDLHVADGELPDPKLPLVLGHQVVGVVAELGEGTRGLQEGDRVGIPWLGWTCGTCEYCRRGLENLCSQARFTGYHRDGGFAEYTVADARYAFRLPQAYDDVHAAPLLCAGLIGYRCLRMAGDARRLGLYGFGAAAHLIAQVAAWQGRQVFAFTRPGDLEAQALAREVGAVWAGGSDQMPPEPLEAAIVLAPVGALVVEALRATAPAGVVVCGGIHMSDIPSFPYRLLWGERVVRSVANLTRQDAEEFLALAPRVPVRVHTVAYALEEVNRALEDLRAGRVVGSAVVTVAR